MSAVNKSVEKWYMKCCLLWCTVAFILTMVCVSILYGSYNASTSQRMKQINEYNNAIDNWILMGTSTEFMNDNDPTNDYLSFRRIKGIVTFDIPSIPYLNPMEDIPKLNTVLSTMTTMDTISTEPEVHPYGNYIAYLTRPSTSASAVMVYQPDTELQRQWITINISLYVPVNHRRRLQASVPENNKRRHSIPSTVKSSFSVDHRFPYSLPPTLVIQEEKYLEQLIHKYGLLSKKNTLIPLTEGNTSNHSSSSYHFLPSYEPLWIQPPNWDDTEITTVPFTTLPGVQNYPQPSSVPSSPINSPFPSPSSSIAAEHYPSPLPSVPYPLSVPTTPNETVNPSLLSTSSSHFRSLQNGPMYNMSGPFEWYSTVSDTYTLQPFSNITGMIEYGGYFYNVKDCIAACMSVERCRSYTWHDNRVVRTWRYQCFFRLDGYFPTTPWMGHWAGAKIQVYAPSRTPSPSSTPTPSSTTVPIIFNNNNIPYVNPFVYLSWLNFTYRLTTWFNSVVEQKCTQVCSDSGKSGTSCSTYCYCSNGGIVNSNNNKCETWYQLVEICLIIQKDTIVGGCAIGSAGFYVGNVRGEVMYPSGTGIYRYRNMNGMQNYAIYHFQPIITVRSVHDPYLQYLAITDGTFTFSPSGDPSRGLPVGYSAIFFTILMVLVIVCRCNRCFFEDEKTPLQGNTSSVHNNNNGTSTTTTPDNQDPTVILSPTYNPLHQQQRNNFVGIPKPIVPYKYYTPVDNLPPPFIPSNYRFVNAVLPPPPPHPPSLSPPPPPPPPPVVRSMTDGANITSNISTVIRSPSPSSRVSISPTVGTNHHRYTNSTLPSPVETNTVQDPEPEDFSR